METAVPEPEEPPPQPDVDGHQTGNRPSAFGFGWLLVLFLAFRILALLLLRPGGFIRDWSDFDTFLGFASISDHGLYPFLHYWLEWPPLVPWLAVGAYKLSLLVPPWPDDYRLWFVLILGSVFVLFEAGNLVLLYRISRRLYRTAQPTPTDNLPTGADHALRPVWIYALLFAPLYAMLGFFDCVALFFLLLALDLTLQERLLSSAVSIGVGFMVKLTPIIFVPVALRQLGNAAGSRWSGIRDSALYLVATLLTIVVSVLPFVLTQPVWLLTMARAIVGRSSWETVWAIMEGYYGYGVVGGDRLNPAQTTFSIHASTLPWWAITLAFGLLYLVVWIQRADYRQPRNVVALTGFTVTLFLLYSKGYSPQFLVYLLPFVVLLFPNGRGVAYSLLLILLNVLEQPVYFVLLPEAHELLVGVITARWLVLGALLIEFVTAIWGEKMARLIAIRRYAPAALTILIGLGLVAGLPFMARAYAGRQLRQDPAASLIGYLGTRQAHSQASLLVVTTQDVLRRFKPYLGDDYTIRLTGTNNLPQGAPTPALYDALANAGTLWLVTGRESNVPPDALNRLGNTLLSYDFGAGYRLELLGRRSGLAPVPPVARLANGVNLIGYKVEQPARQQVLVTLYWWAATNPNQSYTVFTQVLDADGKFVAGHDSLPLNGNLPTYMWQPDHVYADPHLIELPPNTAPGGYQVVAGMYDLNTVRIVARDPDAHIFKDFAVPLGNIE